MLVAPHRPSREDQGTLEQRTREAAGRQAGQGTRHLTMSYVATARPGHSLSPRTQPGFRPSPAPLGQVQALFAKSRRFSPNPVISARVQDFWPKSRRLGPSPAALGQVQDFWSKSRRFVPSQGVLGQVQLPWAKPTPFRRNREIYRTSPKPSLKIPSPAPK